MKDYLLVSTKDYYVMKVFRSTFISSSSLSKWSKNLCESSRIFYNFASTSNYYEATWSCSGESIYFRLLL